jgi:hypothetical protein
MGRSLADDLAADVSRTFLQTDQFGELVTRYPDGDTDTPDDPVGGMFNELPPVRQIDSGDRVVRRGELGLAEATAATKEDSWLVRGEEWQTIAVTSAIAGLKTVHLQRDDVDFTTRSSSARII